MRTTYKRTSQLAASASDTELWSDRVVRMYLYQTDQVDVIGVKILHSLVKVLLYVRAMVLVTGPNLALHWCPGTQ